MEKEITILLSVILLSYKESLTNNDISSNDLLLELIDLIKNSKKSFGDDQEVIVQDLTNYIITMLEEKQNMSTILLTVRSIVGNDDIFSIFDKEMRIEYANESEILKEVGKLYNFINEYFINKKAVKVFQKASMSLKSNREGMGSAKEFLSETIGILEELAMSKGGDVEGIIETIELDDGGLDVIVDDMKEFVGEDHVYKTGFKLLNETFQGGLRPGEYYNLSALSHNNKTGMFDSIITGLAIYNKPINLTPGKKPTILVFKTEDELSKTFTFIFKLLKMTELGINVDIKDFTNKEIKEYLGKFLLRNGWSIIFHNTDPSTLTYRSVMKRVFDLEAKGHEIKICGIDYLTKMSTVGCTAGPYGTDKRDLVKRLMTFFKARKCLIMSPSQTNTAANNLLEEGIEPYELPKIISERGMYADSRQLHQEFDLSTQQHKFLKGGRAYLAIMREKHRTAPEVLEERLKYHILPFPVKGPIPMDLEKKETIGWRSMDTLLKHINNSRSLLT